MLGLIVLILIFMLAFVLGNNLGHFMNDVINFNIDCKCWWYPRQNSKGVGGFRWWFLPFEPFNCPRHSGSFLKQKYKPPSKQ